MNGQRVDGADQLQPTGDGTLVMVGNFDGVHRGHQFVLGRGIELARQHGQTPLVLTFNPHPSEVLGRGARPALTRLTRKLELLARLGPDLRVVVEPFTRELAAASPREFARDLLVRKLGARQVIVGENFRFGHRRAGDAALLAELGRELGFRAHAQALSGDGGGVISSTRIRDLIAAGAVEEAEALLGRPHALSGLVEHGDQRARQLGVPSANLGGVGELMPARGVYAVLVDVLEAGAPRQLGVGVANVGVRPTHGAGDLRAEVHVLGFSGDLYGKELRMHLVARLREERRFDGLDALRAQLAADKEAARQRLAAREPDPRAGGAWH